MSSQIALLLYIILALFLFITDVKRRPKVTYALWIPLIWMIIIASRFVSNWMNISAPIDSPDAYLEGSNLDRYVFLAMIVVGLFILSSRKLNWSLIVKNNTWIFLFFAYEALTILWSEFPFVSFKRWIKEIGNLIMVLIILSEPNLVEAIKTIIRRCAYVLIPLSIVFIKYFPDLGRVYHRHSGELMITGVSLHKNGLGILCATCGIVLVWSLISKLSVKGASVYKGEIVTNIFLLSITLWLLIMANSATSLICFIFGVGMLVFTGFSGVRKNRYLLNVYIILFIIVFLFLELSFNISTKIIHGVGRDTTLTGRTDLWNDILDTNTHPLIGTGYESFWLGDRAEKFWDKYESHPNQAHNGYLDMYINIGLIGLFLFIAVVISSYRKIKEELLFYDYDYGRLRLVFFAIALTLNITESTFRGLSLMWFIFLLIALDVRSVSEPRSSQIP